MLPIGIIRSGLSLFENQEIMKKRYITADEFDKKFDAGEDLSEYLQIDQAKRPALEQKKISLSLPQWMISGIDKKARKMGVSRQAILKTWIAEKLKD